MLIIKFVIFVMPVKGPRTTLNMAIDVNNVVITQGLCLLHIFYQVHHICYAYERS